MANTKGNLSGQKENRNESIALLLKKSVLDDLNLEAEQKMESVNTLVNQIIQSYLQWHKPAKKDGLGYLSKDLMARSMNHLNDEQIIKMTEEFCNHQIDDIIYMLSDDNTFASFMDILGHWLDASGFNYRIDRNDADNTHTYIIYFNMGRKWSLHFKTRMQLVFEHHNIKDAEAEMADNTVILKIKNPKEILD